MTLPPYGFATAFGSWTFDPTVALGVVLAASAYLLAARRAAERGGWPWWRSVCFVVLGLGGVVVCTMSSLAVYDHQHLWALGAQLTLLVALVPVGLALGDPVALARVTLPDRGRAALDRALAGPVVRVLTFPVVAAVLASVFLTAVFFSPVLREALSHASAMNALYLAALLVGCLAALPMLGAEILPEWCTEPFRLLFAFVDGLVDVVPGVLVMTTRQPLAGGWFTDRVGDPFWDVHTAGALMLALSEVVALPIFFIVFFRWAAREGAFDRTAAAADPRLLRGPVTVMDDAAGDAASDPDRMRPWWETEGFGARNRPFRGE